ncbi:MAG: DUF1104 domain-containing protein [Helicobacter sp.]|uniref:DUF1104 domain-containing protein n=1 Tax=Helicobacter sp. TaxID=218 RepID=UPI0023BD4849|nr:DUF1104 domain-containing protein [Helicobacter sp.]MDE7175379.1 DUF1104 domain-containing protein [Helicobacter sp.]
MKTKIILSLALAGTLVSGALAADYSKASNEELIKLSGKVAPKDYPDYRMEIHKRMQEMKVKEAREFRDRLRESHQNAYSNMTHKEYLEHHNALCAEVQKRLDTMSESQAIESGLIGYGYGHHRGYRGEYGQAGNKNHRNCYNRGGYHHFW